MLSAYSPPQTATVYDPLDYPTVGDRLGVGVGADLWEVVTPGMRVIGGNAYIEPAGSNLIAGQSDPLVSGVPAITRLKGTWPLDQWVAANNIAPYGTTGGQAVRVQANGDCYWLGNYIDDGGSTTVLIYSLYRRVGGVDTAIWTWAWEAPWMIGPEEVQDTQIGVIEVSGSNPVTLRVTINAPVRGTTHAVRASVPDGWSQEYWIDHSIVTDASASRITAPGSPGLVFYALAPDGAIAGFSAGPVQVADTTYPTDTTWEVLVPVSEVVGGATFEAVASTGETAEISLTIYESNTTDSTHGTDSNDVVGSNNIDVSVSDSAASSDLTAASVTTTVATSVTATFLLAASIAFVVIYDTATTDTASASDSAAVAMSVRTTDSTTSDDSVGIGIDVPGTTTNTTDSTEATDETTVLELWRALVADSSPSTDAVTVALDVVHQDVTTATDSASVPVWTSATEDSTTSSDTNSLVAIATTIPTNTTDGTGSTDATVVDRTARSTDLSISQDIGSAWQSGPETVASSADDLSTSTDLALVKIRGIADEVKVTVEWADVSTVASVQFVSSVALVYVYVPSKKEVRSWHT